MTLKQQIQEEGSVSEGLLQFLLKHMVWWGGSKLRESWRVPVVCCSKMKGVLTEDCVDFENRKCNEIVGPQMVTGVQVAGRALRMRRRHWCGCCVCTVHNGAWIQKWKAFDKSRKHWFFTFFSCISLESGMNSHFISWSRACILFLNVHHKESFLAFKFVTV